MLPPYSLATTPTDSHRVMERTALALCSLLALVTYSCSQNVPQCVTQPLSGDKIVCNGVDLSLLTAQDISSAYSGSGSKISSVELVNCDVPPSLTFLNTTVLNSLKSLTLDGVSNAHTIIISSFISFISSLEELKLLNMPALTSIDFIKDTDIVRVPWGSMKRLQVNNCGVTEIDPAVWERLSILEYLSLRENHIRNLDFRDTNPFLTELDASNNHIMEILSFKWDTFTMLQKFNMSYNELSDPNILNKIYDTVVDIDLSYNQFTQLTLTASRNSELEFLSLSHNQLTTITPSFFESRRTKLKNLNLSYNKGLELSPLSFANLVYLERLDLHFCRLNSITTEFQNLISLQMLNLSGNALIDLPVDTFKGTDELRYLDLHGNRLSSLSCFSSQSASILLQLQIMDLSGNDLRSLPNLTSLYNLKLLSIRDNRLDKLDNCQHIDSLTRLSQLCMPILSLSPHRCKLQAFVQTMKTNSATNRLAYNNEACCSNPAHTNLDCCVDSPSHPVCQSGSPLNYSSECPSVEELCDPQTTTPTVITGQPSVLEPRENFTDLYASEIAARILHVDSLKQAFSIVV
ncbi:hypothetical protein EB796_013023 [Bugula neritina]|uniref:Uncharacterized protein n=1 Tax=Bugula neritina TaxID=10212 RepID=A0A7J7JRW1_BUGNE|nr:hypothetical protein EB796_013023 [Bugula neritina]